MQTINDINEFHSENGLALTIGKFDGLHRGHQRLLQSVSEKKSQGLLPAVLMILPENGDIKGLLTEEETEKMLEAAGIELFFRVPLSGDIKNTEPEAFIQKILQEKLHVRFLACGADFRFGKERKGDSGLLESLSNKNGFSVKVFEKIRMDGMEISSTLIRAMLKDGNVKSANRLSGYDYGFSGIVIHGRALAGKLGFPTINILPPEKKLLPKNGVYRAEITTEKGTYAAMVNLGTKPTVTEDDILLLEAHLLDFSGDLYGACVDVRLLDFIRPERKFDSLSELQAQILRDLSEIRRRIDCEQSVKTKKND